MTLPPLPEPDTHCFDDDTRRDVWSYSYRQMRAYAEQAVAAELAAQRAESERLERLAEQRRQAAVDEYERLESQQVLKAEPTVADATDRETPATTSPRGGAMGAGQAAALLRELLAAEPVQDEPVAWLKTMYSGTRPILEVDHRKPPATNSIPVYAAPQQPMRCPEDGGECGAGGYCRPEPQQRKPLSDEQVRQIVVDASTSWAFKRDGSTSMRIVRAIERAHGIGEPT